MKTEDLPRFYCSDPSKVSCIELDEEETRHAKVLRLKEGDKMHIVDGQGKLFEGTLERIKKIAEVGSVRLIATEPAANNRLWLAVAPTKNMARFEWIVEKAVELGVDRISPIICERSERINLNMARMHRIVLSAMKQCKGLWLPQMDDMLDFQKLDFNQVSTKWIAHCETTFARADISCLRNAGDQLICIGPEGDFTSTEIEFAHANNCKSLSLGHRRLRTETAAITACIAATLLNHPSDLHSES